jgi:hypothetical protein
MPQSQVSGSIAARREPNRRKRVRSGQACSSCRRNKTRCEPPSGPAEIQCHRCQLLGLLCSFEQLRRQRVADVGNTGATGQKANPSLDIASVPPAASASVPREVNPEQISDVLRSLEAIHLFDSDEPQHDPNLAQQAWKWPTAALYELLRRKGNDVLYPPIQPSYEILSASQIRVLLNTCVYCIYAGDVD